ncbi:MAG TPA: 7-cyano-7-deazaguanine synthase [Pirellulales bacterium]|nr:7-cyano-7-deazaguanine synthase [Pirellulales bacterium]
MPDAPANTSPIGLLLSGGLDSAILLGHLVRQGHMVQPFYVQSQLRWQAAELAAVQQFIAALNSPLVAALAELALPLADLYAGHWSVAGYSVPDEQSPDEAVFLPGRNLLLIAKPAVWCQLNGIEELALATLATNPFDDSSDRFFAAIETAINAGSATKLRIVRPLGGMTKAQVMHLGRALPLELTMSCIDPQAMLHCGHCNKCAERRAAFVSIGLVDPTRYARPIHEIHPHR